MFCAEATARGIPLDGFVMRPPTEAEWEYACRAGTATDWFSGNDEQELLKYANCNPKGWFNRPEGIMVAGRMPPNPWGLRDMHGNVWEMCYDASEVGTETNPAMGKRPVRRGGAYTVNPFDSRSAHRVKVGGDIDVVGFREVLVPK